MYEKMDREKEKMKFKKREEYVYERKSGENQQKQYTENSQSTILKQECRYIYITKTSKITRHVMTCGSALNSRKNWMFGREIVGENSIKYTHGERRREKT